MRNLARCVAIAAALIAVPICAAPNAGVPQEKMNGTWWDETPWRDPERGFNWYPDPNEEIEKKKAEDKPKPKTIYEMSTLEEIKKELERIKGVAVTNPTEANVYEFLKAQNWVMDKSSLFADVARRVVWANPDVNYSARSPVTNFAKANQVKRQSAQRDEVVRSLSQTHGILFFARSGCDFCKDQAPVLRAFSENTGMPVLAVSLDGAPIPMFPEAKPDNGISIMASGGNGINIVPAMFLIERSTKQMIPLGTGVLAAAELAERIRVLTTTKPGQEF